MIPAIPNSHTAPARFGSTNCADFVMGNCAHFVGCTNPQNQGLHRNNTKTILSTLVL